MRHPRLTQPPQRTPPPAGHASTSATRAADLRSQQPLRAATASRTGSHAPRHQGVEVLARKALRSPRCPPFAPPASPAAGGLAARSRAPVSATTVPCLRDRSSWPSRGRSLSSETSQISENARGDDRRGRRRRRRPEGMRQISTAAPQRRGVGDLRLHRRAPTRARAAPALRSRTIRARRRELGRRAAPADAAQARRHAAPRRRRARSRARHPRARLRRELELRPRRRRRGAAARSACATTARRRRARARARPGPRPAGHPASAARCGDARARTARAPARSRGTGPQPITGANPATSCPIDVANRAERCACPSRNR